MQKRGVIVSFALHLTLMALAIFSHKDVPELNMPEVIEIATQPVIEAKKAKVPGGRSHKKESTAGAAAKLFPSVDFGSGLKVSSGRVGVYGASIDQVFGDNGNQNWSYYQEIYRKIDSNLIFDSILAQYSHFGRVYVEFKVTDEGIFEIAQLKATAQDSILKVHVLRAIKKSLIAPLAATKFQKFNTDTLFKAEFDFQFGNPADNFAKQKNFGKPVFVFTRVTDEKPVPDNLKDQLLSGGVSPNISQMFENWKKYNSMKYRNATQFDPFASYKRDEFYAL